MPTLNIIGNSSDPRAARLSNFYADSFWLDGEWFGSVEGFIQGIKFPREDSTRQFAFLQAGKYAKHLGSRAKNKYVWWKGEAIPYQSPEHTALIERAMRARIEQNPEATQALRDTEGLTLMHDVGHPDSPTTSLRREQFVDILTRIRAELIAQK